MVVRSRSSSSTRLAAAHLALVKYSFTAWTSLSSSLLFVDRQRIDARVLRRAAGDPAIAGGSTPIRCWPRSGRPRASLTFLLQLVDATGSARLEAGTRSAVRRRSAVLGRVELGRKASNVVVGVVRRRAGRRCRDVRRIRWRRRVGQRAPGRERLRSPVHTRRCSCRASGPAEARPVAGVTIRLVAATVGWFRVSCSQRSIRGRRCSLGSSRLATGAATSRIVIPARGR